MPIDSSDVVVLSGGLSVSKPALQLTWDLEERGHEIKATEDGEGLLVSTDGLTDQHCEQIQRYKPEIMLLLQYVTSSAVN